MSITIRGIEGGVHPDGSQGFALRTGKVKHSRLMRQPTSPEARKLQSLTLLEPRADTEGSSGPVTAAAAPPKMTLAQTAESLAVNLTSKRAMNVALSRIFLPSREAATVEVEVKVGVL